MADSRLSVVDYVVFALMMLVSALIGVWYGCVGGGKQKTTTEYLLADRDMKALPVAISLLVSFLSAISLLGIPAEIFTYGTQFYVNGLSSFIIGGIVCTVFIPVFRKIKITSANEYLERRFSAGVRILGSCIYIVSTTLYLFVVMYAPALALEAVSGLPLTVSILTTGLLCTFYTALGGLKAVIWADVFQSVVMLIGLVSVAIVGSLAVGGATKVWELNEKFGRINFFDFNPDPTVRNTFWSLTIGGTLTMLPVWCISQYFVQRYLAVKTFRSAKRAMWLNVAGVILVLTVCTYDGMAIFATYAECDLIAQRKITRPDQVLPYFVVDKLGHLTGLPGLFIACLYAACLSTVSSAISGLSLVILEDIIKKIVTLTEGEATKVSKLISVLFGGIIIGGAFIVKYLGTTVLQLAMSITGICGGPYLVLFLFGMFVPRINSKGLYVGSFAGFAVGLWVFIGSTVYPPNRYPGVRSVRECAFYKDALAANLSFTNATYYNQSVTILSKYEDGLIENPFKPHSNPLADFYSLSYLWMAGLSMITAAIVGLVSSLALETEADRQRCVDPKLLFPSKAWLLGFLPGRHFSWDIDEDNQNTLDQEKQEPGNVPLKSSYNDVAEVDETVM